MVPTPVVISGIKTESASLYLAPWFKACGLTLQACAKGHGHGRKENIACVGSVHFLVQVENHLQQKRLLQSRKSDERWTSEGSRWISQRQEHTTDGSFSADYPILRGLQFSLPLLEAVNWVADGCCASSSLGSCWHLAPTGNCRSCAWDGQFLSFPHLWPPKISEHSNIENPSNVWTESNGQTPNLVDTHLKLHDFLVAFGVHRPRERFGSGAFAGARYCGTFPLENPFSGDAGPSRYDAAAAPGLRLILDHLLPSSAARLSRKHGLWLVHRIFHDGLW